MAVRLLIWHSGVGRSLMRLLGFSLALGFALALRGLVVCVEQNVDYRGCENAG